MKNFFLTVSGLVFGLVTALHLVRFVMKWPVVVGTFAVPVKASAWAALISLVLCLGCLVAGGKK